MGIDQQVSIRPPRSLRGELRVPGDKAISHRALLIGSGIQGTILIRGLSPAEDVASTLSSVERLFRPSIKHEPQVQDEGHSGGVSTSLLLEGKSDPGRSLFAESADCGNSGTTMRLLMGILARHPRTVTLTGDASLSRRPMERVATPLRLMGASIGLGSQGRPPVVVTGGQLTGVSYRLPVASAQVKSAVLLAGLGASGTTVVSEPAASRDHTERMLEFLGCPLGRNGLETSIKATDLFGDKEIHIPGDFSSAAFLLAAAAILPGSEVTVRGVGLNPTRIAFLDVLREFGADLGIDDVHERSGEPRGTVTVRAAGRRALAVGGPRVPAAVDELPLVAVLGCAAEGETVVRDAAELRVKESDRIAAIADGLGRMGADIRTLPDGFVVRGPARLRGAAVDAYGDHRIAMALAVAALFADGETVIRGWECVGISYPGFLTDLQGLAVG